MTLEILQKEMISAMKNGDKFRKGVISGMIAQIKSAAIDEGCRDNIPETLVDKVLLKGKKTAQEMIDTCPADRIELLADYVKQFDIIDEFAVQEGGKVRHDADFLAQKIFKLYTELGRIAY